MYYEEIEPDILLKPYVKCLWTLQGDYMENPMPDSIFPDGCMELVFHYGDPFKRLTENRKYVQPHSILVGQLESSIRLKATGKTGIIGVRFFPWGAASFLKTPLHEITNQDLSIENIWKIKGSELKERVYNSPTKQNAINHIQQFLKQQLRESYQVVDLRKLVSYMLKMQGNIRVEQLAYESNKSIRQFNRIVSEQIGLSPKKLCGILRFHHALKLVEKGGQSLTEVSQICGYYDQSHFIREFKSIAGISPKTYLKNTTGLSSLFV